MLSRRELREIILTALNYFFAQKEESEKFEEEDVLNYAVEVYLENKEKEITPEQMKFVKKIFQGILNKKEELDEKISKYVKSLDTLMDVNLNILRLAFYEIDFVEDIPDSVSANEAINLVKKYNPETGSHKLIAGVVGAYLRDKVKQE